VIVDLLQNTLDGLALGAAYALLALGFTLIFGVLRRANLSYGPAILFGAYCATWAFLRFEAGLLSSGIGMAVGTVLAGEVYEVSPPLAFVAMAGLAAFAGFLAFFVRRPTEVFLRDEKNRRSNENKDQTPTKEQPPTAS